MPKPGPGIAQMPKPGPGIARVPEPTGAGRRGRPRALTARRRAESIQRVPIAVSVIGGEALAETGAYNVNRLTQLQPSLQFYSTNPRNSTSRPFSVSRSAASCSATTTSCLCKSLRCSSAQRKQRKCYQGSH